MLKTIINAIIVALVLYLIYFLIGLIAHGIILTIAAVILILLFVGYLLRSFGIDF